MAKFCVLLRMVKERKTTPEERIEAVKLNPEAYPLFRSDGGFRYINKTFHSKLAAQNMR